MFLFASLLRPFSDRLLRALILPAAFFWAGFLGELRADGVPAAARQLIVAVAPDWNSKTGTMSRYERDASGAWKRVGRSVPILFGKNGLAWGSGAAGSAEAGLHKRERDGRTPAGVFAVGTIYTADPTLPPGGDYPFRTVTEADAWPDDPGNPYYNQHLVFPEPASRPPWFAKQRMKSHDPAYRWRVEIRHNSDPIVPDGGSAIFLHIRRGETRPTSGCTTMAEADLRELVCWLRAGAQPQFVALPQAEYDAHRVRWSLP